MSAVTCPRIEVPCSSPACASSGCVFERSGVTAAVSSVETPKTKSEEQ